MSSGSAAPELVAPAHLWVPERAGSLGGEAVDLAAAVGLVLEPEQRLLLDAVLSVDAAGRLVALETCTLQARQNGKTAAHLAIALADLFLFAEPHDLFVWTAHRFKTTFDAFLDFRRLVDGSDMLTRRVKKITGSALEASVELHDGSRLNFLARQTTGGRGLASRRVTLDEAFAVTPGIMASLFPVMSAQRDPQIRHVSSAALPDSDVLRGLRDRGRRGGDPGLVLAEWCAPKDSCARGALCDHALDTEGCALDDEALLSMANPMAGRRIGWEYLRKERRAFSATPQLRAEQARERLGWHDDPDLAGRVISDLKWADCLDSASTAPGEFTAAVDVDKDRTSSSVAWCGLTEDGLPHGELARVGPGTSWVVEQLTRMAVRRVTLNGAGAPASLIPDLESAGIEVVAVSGREFTQACGAFYDAVVDGRFRHIGQEPLDAAVAGARKRQLESAWAWSRRDSAVDISPLVAVTLAHWAWLSRPTESPFVPLIAYR